MNRFDEGSAALIVGGTGPQLMRETLSVLPCAPDRVWTAVADNQEAAAASGLSNVVVVSPWPGPAAALERLIDASFCARGNAPVLILSAGQRIRRAQMVPAEQSIARGRVLVCGARHRLVALRQRARMRFLKHARIRPATGLLASSTVIATLRDRGWLSGRPVRVRDLAALGTSAVRHGFVASSSIPTSRQQTITVMIPAHNEAPWIGDTLRSVWAQTRRPDDVIVIDDVSTDGTGEIARGLGARVVRPASKRGRKGAALNAGLPHVWTDAVVIVDADTILHPEALEHTSTPPSLAAWTPPQDP